MKLSRLCRQIEAERRRAFLVHLDQTDPASCSAAVEATVNALGRLDILINNAAWNDPSRLPISIRSRPRSGIEP